MKNIDKWLRLNGTFIALNDENKLIGFIRDVKPVIRTPEKHLEDVLEDL